MYSGTFYGHINGQDLKEFRQSESQDGITLLMTQNAQIHQLEVCSNLIAISEESGYNLHLFLTWPRCGVTQNRLTRKVPLYENTGQIHSGLPCRNVWCHHVTRGGVISPYCVETPSIWSISLRSEATLVHSDQPDQDEHRLIKPFSLSVSWSGLCSWVWSLMNLSFLIFIAYADPSRPSWSVPWWTSRLQ